MIDPRDLARQERHSDRPSRQGCPADVSALDSDCTCQPYPERLQAWWQGRARMAHARRAAGAMLDAYDRQAIDRYPVTT